MLAEQELAGPVKEQYAGVSEGMRGNLALESGTTGPGAFGDLNLFLPHLHRGEILNHCGVKGYQAGERERFATLSAV